MDNPYILVKKKAGNEESKLKLQSQWMEVGMKNLQVNFKEINTFHCALNPIEFN